MSTNNNPQISVSSQYKSTNNILEGLLRQIKPVDFLAIANPRGDQDFKLKNSQALVISIDEILKLAKVNNWNLCINNGNVYLYNGFYWSEVPHDLLKSFLGEAAARQGIDKLTSKHFNYRDNLLKQFFSAAYLKEPEADPDKVLINLQNGTLEISANSGEIKLREFKASDFLKYQLPFEYDPLAKAPLFVDYLQHVLPDPSSRDLLLEYAGSLFIKHSSGKLKLEKVLLLYGTGANGKSVFFEILTRLLGKENVSYYSLANLTDNTGYYRAEIADKLLNYASEINGTIGTDHFKAMASGEPITARRPYGYAVTLSQYSKLIFNCNELPKDTEQTHGFFRRFMIIPFEVTIPPERQDKELHIKISESELSGILNLIVKALLNLLERGDFTKCDAAENAVKQYQLESDTVRMYLHENEYQPSKLNLFLPFKTLFDSYKEYCIESMYRTCSKRTFSDRLKKQGYLIEKKRDGVIVYIEKTKCFVPPSLHSHNSHSEADREESEEREAILQSFEIFEESNKW